jgi:pimeloyl-ACP methyl ester carboxylesterase
MGGFVALQAAAREQDLCAVVAICPAPEELLLRLVRAEVPELFRCDVEATVAWLRSASLYDAAAELGPETGLLLMHARGDEQVPYSVSEQLHAVAHEPKRLLLMPGGHHRSIQHDQELQAVSRRFVRARARARR